MTIQQHIDSAIAKTEQMDDLCDQAQDAIQKCLQSIDNLIAELEK